jgi:hypothetical protein
VRALDNPVEEIAKPNLSFHQLPVIIPLCKYSIFRTFLAYRTQIFPLSLITGFPLFRRPFRYPFRQAVKVVFWPLFKITIIIEQKSWCTYSLRCGYPI